MRILPRSLALSTLCLSGAVLCFSPGSLISQDKPASGETSPPAIELKRHAYSSPRIKAILKRGVLRVGMHTVYPPFRVRVEDADSAGPVNARTIAQDEYPGIDVELAHALARELDVQLEIRPGNIRMLMSMVQKGEVDLALGGISSTLDRARYVQFAEPYLITTPALLLSRSSLPDVSQSEDFDRRRFTSIGDLKRLSGVAVGVVRGTTTARLLKEDPGFRRHDIKEFPNRASLLAAYDGNDIDALAADAIFIRALVLAKPAYLGRAVALTQPYSEEHLSPITAYGDPEFLQILNFFLKEMGRDGVLKQLELKYLENNDWVKQ